MKRIAPTLLLLFAFPAMAQTDTKNTPAPHPQDHKPHLVKAPSHSTHEAPHTPPHPARKLAHAKPEHSTPDHNKSEHNKLGHTASEHDKKEQSAPASKPAQAKPVPPAKPPKPEDDPSKGSSTGLPLPRFAALKSDDVYMRVGPGTRYPIQWVYKRRNLPVEIMREFDNWRLVQDQEGVKGWVHQATLTGRRSFQVVNGEQTMRASADDQSAAVARLQPGVIGHLLNCEATAAWCKVQVQDYRGWLKRDEFWGAEPNEAIQ